MVKKIGFLLSLAFSASKAWNVNEYINNRRTDSINRTKWTDTKEDSVSSDSANNRTSVNRTKWNDTVWVPDWFDAIKPSIPIPSPAKAPLAVPPSNDKSSPVTYETAPPTDNSTETPTESPAPSPSPSDVPTYKPTLTPRPTPDPTASPTESPAPSPSPTELPTEKPSDTPSKSPTLAPTVSNIPTLLPSIPPSDAPTLVPSFVPSLLPSESSAPSNKPSRSPSDFPSSPPSWSVAPSFKPSVSPTTSVMPSFSPTVINMVSANYFVQLELKVLKLSDLQIKAFEEATSAWIEMTDASSGKLTSLETNVIQQAAVNITSLQNNTARNLKESDFTPAVQLKFSVSATYIGTDNGFSLFDEYNPKFQDENSAWIQRLASENSVFEPLQPPITSSAVSSGQDSTTGSTGMAPMGMATLSLVAVGAVVLGVIASIYSVRNYKMAAYGEELRSPVQSSDDADDNNDTLHSLHTGTMDVDERQGKIRVAIKSLEKKSNESQRIKYMQKNSPMSPNTLERGMDQESYNHAVMMNTHPNPYASQNNNNVYPHNIQHLQNSYPVESRHYAQDPPSAESEANFSPRQDPQTSLFDNQTDMSTNFTDFARGRTVGNEQRDDTTTTDETDFPDDDDTSRVSSNSNNDRRDSSNRRYSTGSKTSSLGSYGRELMLIHSQGGTLGAAAVTGPYAESAVSDTSEFYFMAKQKNPVSNSAHPTNLGARAVAPEEKEKFEERSSYGSVSRRGGLYDVFAPSGPIGIVVDTTKHGPVVHSLKPTSPMLGLINPGDLIVGLDDMDTRSMTAASLTRLMARKSNQKERKITLLALD